MGLKLEEMFKKNLILRRILVLLVLLGSLVWLAVFSFPKRGLNLVFCDVGQGDAILLTLGFSQVLIDGGPNEKVLDCVAKNMAFFDKKIELVVLTHPDFDHLTGVVAILKKYKVDWVLTGPEESDSGVYREFARVLEDLSKRGKTKVKNPYAGDRFRLGEINFKVLWPEKNWLAERLLFKEQKENLGKVVLGAKTKSVGLNDFSVVLLAEYQGRKILLPGDAGEEVIYKFIDNITNLPIDILKFPHHGSKTGMSLEELEKLRPKVVVISVGKNNYGHPAGETLEKIAKVGAKVRRTDVEGEIKIEVGGQ